MYAQAGLLLPFIQDGFPQGAPSAQNNFLFPAEDDLIYTCLPTAALDVDNGTRMSTIYEYDLGEGDLFKAPEPLLGEPMHELDPVAAVMYMMSDDGSILSGETIEAASKISPVPDEDDLLNEVFYECKRELIAVSAISEPPFPEASEIEDAPLQSKENNATAEEPDQQKCVSFRCASSDPGDCNVRSNFLGFHEVDFENACGVRRSCSEGDIKTLGGNCSVVCDRNVIPSFKLLSGFRDIKIEDRIEERRQKIFRYQKKRTKRNFGRKIKYACRKALADSQPRIRGRFARNEDRKVKA